MTIRLNSLGAMALVLVEREAALYEALSVGLERVLTRIERTAQAEFGTYQPGTGPFPEWPELADATKEDRLQKGFTENDPLLRSGDLKGSVTHEREGLEGVVGSEDPVMAYQELGTDTIPARPVLGPAAFNNKAAIEKLIGAAVVTGIVGADQARGLVAGIIHEGLGYNFETKDGV